MSWTDERVELLKKLWFDGLGEPDRGRARRCDAQRGDRQGASAGAAGRAKRQSAPRVRTAPRASGVRRPSPSLGRMSSGIASMMKSRSLGPAPMHGATALKIETEFETEVYVAPQVQELFIPVEQRLSLLELSEHTCKWPIGDPLTPDFYFCGNHSGEGKPYCEFHSRRCPPAGSRRSAADWRRGRQAAWAPRAPLLQLSVANLSSNAYPAPRTVRIGSCSRPRLMALRSRPTCTSTVRSST